MNAPRTLTAALLLALALALGACGSSDKSDTSSQSAVQPSGSSTDATTTTPKSTTTTQSGDDDQDLNKKPVVGQGTGAEPTKLGIFDIVKGKGPAAKAGDALSVQYVGVLFHGGQQFDASWDRGQPFQFTLGTGGVIPGWDMGLVGMKVGGRRQLTIPAGLAYGAQGQGGIPPNSPLIFVIDLKKIG